MSGLGSSSYSGPQIIVPYTVPASTPDTLKPFLAPIYAAFNSFIQTLIRYCGIAPRNSSDYLAISGDPSTVLANNMHRFYLPAAEAIAAGAPVNLVYSGLLMIQNANATDGTKPADGFCSQTGGIAIGATGEIILSDGVVTGLSGLTPGARYYLGTAAGTYTSVAPVAAGNLQQFLGIALNATTLRFWTGTQVQH